MSWPVEEIGAPAAELHARPLPSPASRLVTVCHVPEQALVLGSTQGPPAGEPGMPVVRRRSGGGAVIVGPGEILWIDVVLPVSDPFWERDVGHAFLWLGEVWAQALVANGVEGTVHRGALQCSSWGRQVCFAGVGPGEVSRPGGGKVVGIAQRRTRELALFQCAALLRWDPAAYVAALGLPPSARAELEAAGAPLTAVSAETLLTAFLLALP